MGTNFAALAYVAGGGATAQRTFGVRHSDVINVKDWGAKGDGVQDDRPFIQAAMDYCFPLGGVNNDDQTAAIASLYFPPGNYRCSTFSQTLIGDNINFGTPVGFGRGVLVLNYARRGTLFGVHMLGDSSATTRIFYDGPVDTTASHSTVLLDIDVNVERSLYEGLHFDMTPSGAYPDINSPYTTLCAWNRGRPWSNNQNVRAGHNNLWRDVKFTGGTWGLGMSGEGANLGSETMIMFCKFVGNARGLACFSANALGYNVIGGYCKNNDWGGIIGQLGAFAVVMGVEFANNGGHELGTNHLGDMYTNGNAMFVAGCTSTSLDFVEEMNGDMFLLGNYHNPPTTTTGRFIWPSTSRICCLTGNRSTGSLVQFNTDAFGLYLRSNQFDNSPNHLAAGGNSYVNMPYRLNVKEPEDPGDHSFDLNY